MTFKVFFCNTVVTGCCLRIGWVYFLTVEKQMVPHVDQRFTIIYLNIYLVG